MATKKATTKRIPKTEVILVIQGNYGYGHGWEDVSAYPEDQYKQARADLREYHASNTGSHRMIRRRVDRVTQEPARRASRTNGYARKAAPKRRTRRNPEVECREPKSKFDRYRGAKVLHKGEFVQLEGCFTGARYVGRAEGAKKRTTISKKVVRQKASRTPSRVKGVRARKRK